MPNETDVRVTTLNDDLQQENLTPEQFQQLFSRANIELVTKSTDNQQFLKREAIVKTPKTNKIIQTSFPPTLSDHKEEDFNIDIEQLAKQQAGPLIIERYSPNQNQIDYIPVAKINWDTSFSYFFFSILSFGLIFVLQIHILLLDLS